MKTAVEQFTIALYEKGLLTGNGEEIQELLEQHLEMEKGQQNQLSTSWAKSREQTRETAMHIGFAKGFMSGLECYEDYYLELENTDLDEDEFTRNYIIDRFEETQEDTNESN
jgi:hypothetical protein